jgi:RNase P subunit RPR2
MFVIDRENGERPICKKCRKPFAATLRQIEAFRRAHPRTEIVCSTCIVRECGKPETLHREAAVAL